MKYFIFLINSIKSNYKRPKKKNRFENFANITNLQKYLQIIKLRNERMSTEDEANKKREEIVLEKTYEYYTDWEHKILRQLSGP